MADAWKTMRNVGQKEGGRGMELHAEVSDSIPGVPKRSFCHDQIQGISFRITSQIGVK